MEMPKNTEIETELIKVIEVICEEQNIKEDINSDFCPGKYIMSQILVSIIPEIEIRTGYSIPIECYIFHDNKTRQQLSIKDAVSKLIKEGKYEQH